MIPKNEKELELYFKLKELEYAKECMDKPYSMTTPTSKEMWVKTYEHLKKEYLELAKDIK